MKVNTKELGKMLENGEVLATDLLPRLALELNKTFVPTTEMLNGPQAAINRMKQAFIDLSGVAGEAGFLDGVTNFANALNDLARSDAVVDIVKGLSAGFKYLSENTSLVAASLGGAAAAFAAFKAQAVMTDIATAGTLTKVNALKLGLNSLMAVFASAAAGFAIGDWANQFETVRLAGSYMFEAFLHAFENVKLSAALAFASIKLTVYTVLTSVGLFFVKSAQGWVEIFSTVAEKIDGVIGSDLAKMFEPAKASLQAVFDEVDTKGLGAIKGELAAASEALATFSANVKSNHEIMVEQRDEIRKQGEAAAALGMTIGELEAAQVKKARADKMAAEWAADLAEQTRVLNEATVKNTGLNNLERMASALTLVSEAAGRADETAGSILKLGKDIDKLNRIISTSPKVVGEMEDSLKAFNKQISEYRKSMSKAKDANDMDEYKRLAENLATAENEVARLQNGIETMPSTLEKLKDGVHFLNVELAEVSRTDADKYFDDTTNKLIQQEIALESSIVSLEKYKDAAVAAAWAEAIANGVETPKADMIADQVAIIIKLKEELDRLRKTYKSTSDIFSEGFGDMFEDMGKTLAPSLQDAISSGDWAGVGKSIGNMLSSTLSATVSESLVSSLGGGAMAGILGPIGGAIAGGIVDLAVNKIGDYLSGDYVDPTADRQAANGTGTVLGSIDAKSQSIANATDLIAASNDQLVSINRKMLGALENLTRSILSASTQVMKDRSKLDFTAPVVDENLFKANAGTALLGANVVAILDGAMLGLGSLLGNAIGKLLGGKTRKVDEGIKILGGNITDLVNNTVVQAFVDYKSRSWKFGKWKNNTDTESLGSETDKQFTAVFSDIVDSVTAGASALGMASEDIKAALAGFTVDTTLISTEGLDAAGQEQALQEYFSTIFDKLAIAVLPMLTELQKGAEGPAETLARVSTEYSLATEAYRSLGFSIASNMGELIPAITRIDLFGKAISELAVPTDVLIYAASELVNLVGGVDAFSEALASFEQNFLTESENFINLSRRLGDAMGDLPLPETRDGFKELLQAQSATTEGGRENIALLLKLQGVADGYYSKLEDWSSKISSSFKNATTVDISSDQLNAYLARLKEGSIDIEALTTEIGLLSGAALDAGEAIAGLTATQQEARDLEIRKLELLGDASGALSLKRDKELESTQEANREALRSIYVIEDSIAAEKELEAARLEALNTTNAAVAAYHATGFQASNTDGLSLTAEQIDNVSKSLVDGVGDIASFNTAVSAFTSNFISEEMKLAKSTNELTSKFAEYGMTVPATRDAFVELYQSLNVMTKSGKQGVIEMLKISAAADTFYKAQEAAATRMYDLESRLLSAQGKELQLVSRARVKELAAASDTEKAILRQIYAAEDLNTQRELQADTDSKVADVRDRLNSAYQTEISNLSTLTDKMRGLGSSLRDFGTSLKVGELSTLTPQQQLAVARSEFTSTANAAQGGDVGAIERLQAVATTFLEESRSFQGSGGTYSADFDAVQTAISNSATVAELQAQQAERHRLILENQLDVQKQTQQEQANIRQAVEALVAVQRESGTLSLQQLNEIRRSMAILESNSSLSTSQ
jgi:hypothetical protein